MRCSNCNKLKLTHESDKTDKCYRCIYKEKTDDNRKTLYEFYRNRSKKKGTCLKCGKRQIIDAKHENKCYKCIWYEKIKERREEKKKRLCKMCKNDLPKNRWKYCSKSCSAKSEVIRLKNRWYLMTQIQKMTWF